MNSAPSPADPAGTSEALVEAPPQLVALLAERAPDAGAPSRAVLAAALLRIQNQQQNQILQPKRPSLSVSPPPAEPRRARHFYVPSWSGWAAAAGLAILFAWEQADPFGHRIHHGSGAPLGGVAAMDVPGIGESPAGSENSADSHGSGGPEFPPGAANSKSRKVNGLKTRPQTLTAVQNMAQLRRDLAKLRASNQARFQSSPGLSRTVVVEMTDPSDPREAARLGALRLSDRVAESIAAGVTADSGNETASLASTTANEKSEGSEPSPQTHPPGKSSEQDLVLSGGDGSWNGDIVIEKGLPNTGLFNLPEGTQIKHLDFPVEDAASYRGLQDLGSGWFYDQFSDLLWQPTGEGKTYIGQKAPTGFDRETFAPPASAASPQLAENPTVPAADPAADPAPAAAPPAESGVGSTGSGQGSTSSQLEIATNSPPVRGYPIFDETTGSGSIILQNLPNLGEFNFNSGFTSTNSGRSDNISTSTAGSGQSYQLWVTDPASDTPISVGLIPSLDGGNGRVWFDLGSPGVAPSGYILTVEPSTGSTVPSGKVVLQGP